MNIKKRQLHLGLMFWATGTHSAGWRHPAAKTDGAFDIAFIQQMAQKAEQGKFDFLFLGDRLVADPALAKTNPGQMARLEPFVAGTAIAAATRSLGIVVTTNTTYNDPFTVARMMASLDHLSHGRASWNIVTGADHAAAFNFSRDHHWDTAQRYAWANAFTETVIGLWHSWDSDAWPPRQDNGPGIHPLTPGKDGLVPGPSPLPRPPQGKPVILHAGTSAESRDLGAHYADVIFSGHAVFDEARDYYRDIKQRALAYGRSPDSIKILPGLIVIVEETTAEAVAVWDKLNNLIILDAEETPVAAAAGAEQPHFQYVGMGRGAKRNLTLASQALGVEVTGNDLDTPVPAAVYQQASPAGRVIIDYITRMTRRNLIAEDRRQRITYRDLVYAAIAQTHAVVGNPQEVADYLQYWLEQGAADGFNIFPSFLPDSLDRFVDLVVPELQRRGIYRTDYQGKTLRDHFAFTGVDTNA